MQAIVVDDSRTVRMILKRILDGLGFGVLEAGDGVEALALIESTPGLRLALVDWNMPRMDGLSLVKTLRGREEFADLVVMMVTSESGVPEVSAALEAGANEFVMKPFTRETITDKLAMLGVC